MEREFEILQKINKRKVALKNQEKLRKKEVDKMNEKNIENSNFLVLGATMKFKRS